MSTSCVAVLLRNEVRVSDKGESREADEGWTSYIYAFFDPVPEIEYVDNRRTHVFQCSACGCKQPRLRRFLDTKDRSSTSNMAGHV